jgi:hypothetical protein
MTNKGNDMNKIQSIIGYHFSGPALHNGEPIPPVGEWITCTGTIIPCVNGLHCSEEPWDALKYLPGHLLHRVELCDELEPHGNPIDKWVGRKRRILSSIDAEQLLRRFAREQTLGDIHLCVVPSVVLQYLSATEDTLWAAAAAAALASGFERCDPAWEAAWTSARDAAKDTFNRRVYEAFK